MEDSCILRMSLTPVNFLCSSIRVRGSCNWIERISTFSRNCIEQKNTRCSNTPIGILSRTFIHDKIRRAWNFRISRNLDITYQISKAILCCDTTSWLGCSSLHPFSWKVVCKISRCRSWWCIAMAWKAIGLYTNGDIRTVVDTCHTKLSIPCAVISRFCTSTCSDISTSYWCSS